MERTSPLYMQRFYPCKEALIAMLPLVLMAYVSNGLRPVLAVAISVLCGYGFDALMHKMRIAQKVHIELEWQNVADSVAQTVLTAFQPEYINVNYYDYKSMAFLTKRFYVGDRTVTSYNRTLGIGTISFNIIEQ